MPNISLSLSIHHSNNISSHYPHNSLYTSFLLINHSHSVHSTHHSSPPPPSTHLSFPSPNYTSPTTPPPYFFSHSPPPTHLSFSLQTALLLPLHSPTSSLILPLQLISPFLSPNYTSPTTPPPYFCSHIIPFSLLPFYTKKMGRRFISSSHKLNYNGAETHLLSFFALFQ